MPTQLLFNLKSILCQFKKILAVCVLLFLQFNAWAFYIHPDMDQTICPGKNMTLGLLNIEFTADSETTINKSNKYG